MINKSSGTVQFRLRSLFVATLAVAIVAALFREFWGLLGPLLALIVILGVFVGPIISIVYLQKPNIDYTVLGKCILTVCPGLHSVVLLMLATFVLAPTWKGSKGEHWGYYLLDAPAGYTLWPFYWVGTISFIVAVWNPRYALRSRFNLLMIYTLITISAWYVIAVIFLRFAGLLLVYFPAMACFNFTLFAIQIHRNREFEASRPLAYYSMLAGWFGSLAIASAMKIPMAMEFYRQLANSHPQNECFIVSAAARGHRWFVGTWEDESGRAINHQLITFRQFEANLARHTPRFHRILRTCYNAFAPTFARWIVLSWMADITYLLLKPMEWLALCLNRIFRLRSG